MQSAIGRLRTLGIAIQSAFDTPAVSATFVLPLTNAPMFAATVNKIENDAALGSAYTINDIEKTTRFAELSPEYKIDEDIFGLMLRQRFSVVSTTASEVGAYRHVFTFENNTQCWYTLFLQDDNLRHYVVKNALLDDINLSFDNDFVRAASSVVGSYPTQTTVTNVVTQPKEFVGRMVNFADATVPGTATNTATLSVTGNLDFGLNTEDTRFGLGSQDLAVLRLTSDKYTFNISRLKSDVSRYDDNENNVAKTAKITVQSTDRFVGATTGTRPSIEFSIPRAKIQNYTEEPDLNELTKENFDLTAVKPAGVAGAPMTVTIVNATVSY